MAADLGIGFSTLNKWISQNKHDDLISGPHDDVQKELARLRKVSPRRSVEIRILKEERGREADGTSNFKKATVFIVPACWGFASQNP